MSQTLLILHLVGAFVALCVSITAVVSTFLKSTRTRRYSRLLSGVFIINTLSGLFLAIGTATPVISICDNLVLYAVLFALVQGWAFWRMYHQEVKVTLSPLYVGVGISTAFTVLALVIGF